MAHINNKKKGSKYSVLLFQQKKSKYAHIEKYDLKSIH